MNYLPCPAPVIKTTFPSNRRSFIIRMYLHCTNFNIRKFKLQKIKPKQIKSIYKSILDCIQIHADTVNEIEMSGLYFLDSESNTIF